MAAHEGSALKGVTVGLKGRTLRWSWGSSPAGRCPGRGGGGREAGLNRDKTAAAASAGQENLRTLGTAMLAYRGTARASLSAGRHDQERQRSSIAGTSSCCHTSVSRSRALRSIQEG